MILIRKFFLTGTISSSTVDSPMEESPSRTLRSSATSPPIAQLTSKSTTPRSEMTEKTKESVLAGKRKMLLKALLTRMMMKKTEGVSPGKRARVENEDNDQTNIEFNREEKKMLL